MAARLSTDAEARAIVDTLVKTLEHNFSGFNISEIVKGGSMGHGTGVHGNFDIDLVIYSEDIKKKKLLSEGYTEWLKDLKTFLESHFRGAFKLIRQTQRAVQFTFQDKIDVDLLVSPYWSDQHEFYSFLTHTVPAERRDDFTVCASKWQVEFFKDVPSQVKECIRKAKAWRNAQWPIASGGSGRPSSYLMSLLVVAAYERNPGNVTQAVKDIVTEGPDECWTKFYVKTNTPDKPNLPSRPRIVDPANPANNVWMSGFKSYKKGERVSNYEPGDGNSAVLKSKIHSINLQ